MYNTDQISQELETCSRWCKTFERLLDDPPLPLSENNIFSGNSTYETDQDFLTSSEHPTNTPINS